MASINTFSNLFLNFYFFRITFLREILAYLLTNMFKHEQGPGGVWCDVDVVEFSYFGAPAQTPKEQLYTELVDGLRGSDPCIGSGSQVFLLLLLANCWFYDEKTY